MLPLLLACRPAPLVLVPTGAPVDTAVEVHAHAGAWSGTISWWMEEWDWEICAAGEVELEVDDEGLLSGEGSCRFEADDWTEDLDWAVEGELRESGEASGEIVWETWVIAGQGYSTEDIDADLEGGVDEGLLALDFEASSYMGEYGFVPVTGRIEASLD